MSISADRFSEFFDAVHGFRPFPWQTRLAQRVIEPGDGEGRAWPRCLALPTGSGKTACIDIAIFALAYQAHLPPHERTAPRKIIFVVDRRVIVDEAFEHAMELARHLYEAKKPILKEVAEALREIGGHQRLAAFNKSFDEAVPLTCHQLRGGVYRDDAWARTPTQPCVITSTVDQIGSRILFRGYGRSNRTWPVHAGLAGNDSLIILDEAHCANPFLQTMQWIDRYRSEQWAEFPLRSPFQFVVMSATPPQDESGNEIDDVMKVDDADRNDPVLGTRIKTGKPTQLLIAKKTKGANWQRPLALELVRAAISLVRQKRLAVAVLVNRVATAKLVDQIFREVLNPELTACTPAEAKEIEALRKTLPESCTTFEHVLMTGRMRPFDKELVTNEWLHKLKADPRRLADASPVLGLPMPVFLTATQCLEVGANLDFDAMVSECASFDALRQRFGRLNRVGRWNSAPGVVVVREDQTTSKNRDPVYGESLAATWNWLASISQESDDGTVDFGVSNMSDLWESVEESTRSTLILQGHDAPVMLPAYVDCWVQTSPEPTPSPDVSLFLHGPQSGPPEIQVCWRADLPSSDRYCMPFDPEREPDETTAERNRERAIEAISLCPPSSRECLPVPITTFRRWWADALISDTDEELSDISTLCNEVSPPGKKEGKLAIIWRGPDESIALNEHQTDLRPGDTVVLPQELKGWDVFGHLAPSNSRVIDVGDECYRAVRGRAVLRLHPDLVGAWDLTCEISRELREHLNANNDDNFAKIRDLIERQELDDTTPLSKCWRTLDFQHRIPHPFGGWVLYGKARRAKSDEEDPVRHRITKGETFTTEDETSSAGPRVIPLAEHLEGVSQHAEAFGLVAGLPDELVSSLALAGLLHDLGKADSRFQAMLHGGSFRRFQALGQLLAKSLGLPITPAARRDARSRSGLPKNFRHELLSLQFVEQVPELIGSSDVVDRDLILHLVSAHHGQCRPFADVVIDELRSTDRAHESNEQISLQISHSGKLVSVTAEQRCSWTPPHQLDSGVPDRFWRLVRRYGWWGLAWLEAMFILADHRQSEWESRISESDQEQPEAAT